MRINRKLFLVASALLIAWMLLALTPIDLGSLSLDPPRAAAQEPDSEIRFVVIPGGGEGDEPTDPSDCPASVNYKDEELGAEREPNNTSAAANLVATPYPPSKRGNIKPQGDQDWYRFEAKSGNWWYGATSTLASSNCNKNTKIAVYDKNGALIEEDDNAGSITGDTASSIAGATLPTSGKYSVQVTGVGSGTIQPYHLYTRVVTDQLTAEVEPNNSPGAAQPLPPDGHISGMFNSASDGDWYRLVNVPAGATVYVALDLRDSNGANGRAGMGLFNGVALLADDANTDTNPSEAFVITVKNPGDYYVYADAPGAAPNSPYLLSATVYPPVKPNMNCENYVKASPSTIPGDNTIKSSQVITFAQKIADVDVNLQIQNVSSPANIELTLEKSDGTKVPLVAGVGDPSFNQMNTGFSDEAGVPPYEVFDGITYQPQPPNRLSDFDGKNANGTWTLSIQNTQASSNGALVEWSLEICNGVKPGKPQLVSPANGATLDTRRVLLDWDAANGANTYNVIVKEDTKKGPKADEKKDLAKTKYKTDPLDQGQTYWWRVAGCNDFGCKWSTWRNFSIPP